MLHLVSTAPSSQHLSHCTSSCSCLTKHLPYLCNSVLGTFLPSIKINLLLYLDIRQPLIQSPWRKTRSHSQLQALFLLSIITFILQNSRVFRGSFPKPYIYFMVTSIEIWIVKKVQHCSPCSGQKTVKKRKTWHKEISPGRQAEKEVKYRKKIKYSIRGEKNNADSLIK